MRTKALILTLVLLLPSAIAQGVEESPPRIAVAYDIGFLEDNSYNDAVHAALILAQRKFKIAEPNLREIPTTGSAVDRLTRLRFLAKSGYSLVVTVGNGYRETVKRVSMEFPLTQFAIINDDVLGQLNISNIAFDEGNGAYLAGTVAAGETKSKSVGILGGSPEMISEFRRGAASVSKKINVRSFEYSGDAKALRSWLPTVDILYSGWDKDGSVLEAVSEYKGKIKYIARIPDQYFFYLKNRPAYVIAAVKKDMNVPVLQLVQLGLENRAIIDVLDEVQGIYGRRYGVKNKAITIEIYSKITSTTKSKLTSALKDLSK